MISTLFSSYSNQESWFKRYISRDYIIKKLIKQEVEKLLSMEGIFICNSNSFLAISTSPKIEDYMK